MKKGFTMIELIFVIVILGILAAVAIPRLAATRDDAEIAKAATNAATMLSDLSAYYTAQGSFGTALKDMTNVVLSNNATSQADATGLTGYLLVKGKGCLKITVSNSAAAGSVPKSSAVTANIDIEKETSVQTDPICQSLYAVPAIAKMIGKHDVGGTSIKF